MRARQGAVLQSLRAAKSFIDANADKLAAVLQTGARKRLDDVIAALDVHASEQNADLIVSQGLTQRQRKLRVLLLRDHMKAIARIAIADLPNTPEFAPLRMPRGRPTPEKLAAAAAGMAKAATQYTSVFTAAGLPTDFIDQLNASGAAMVGALVDRTVSRGSRRGATSGLKTKLAEGRKVVDILDAFVTTALQGDSALLDNWKTVTRVSRTGANGSSATDSSTPPTTATPTTTTTTPASTTSASTTTSVPPVPSPSTTEPAKAAQ